jgi:hypothetical protein
MDSKNLSPGERYDGYAFAKDDLVVTATTGWCNPIGCDIVRGVVGQVKMIHRGGLITASLRYRGKTFRWKSDASSWLAIDEWIKSDPESYKKWKAFKKRSKAAKALASTKTQGVHP